MYYPFDVKTPFASFYFLSGGTLRVIEKKKNRSYSAMTEARLPQQVTFHNVYENM